MALTRKTAAGAADVDLEAGKTSSEVGVIVEKIELNGDVLDVSRMMLAVYVEGEAGNSTPQEELTNMLNFLATAREHRAKPIVGSIVTILFLLLSGAAFADAIRRIVTCGDNAECHDKTVPEFVGGAISLIFMMCAYATTCHKRPEDQADKLIDLLSKEQLSRVIVIAAKHDIRLDQDHRIHLAEQKFRGRLTYLNCQHHNPVDRLFKNRQPQSDKVVNERTSLLPIASRSPA